jgi:hypothetical protein
MSATYLYLLSFFFIMSDMHRYPIDVLYFDQYCLIGIVKDYIA